jgi:hypothetical protein
MAKMIYTLSFTDIIKAESIEEAKKAFIGSAMRIDLDDIEIESVEDYQEAASNG